jgi:hypothetical protein
MNLTERTKGSGQNRPHRTVGLVVVDHLNVELTPASKGAIGILQPF